jgi:hypothetical protein
LPARNRLFEAFTDTPDLAAGNSPLEVYLAYLNFQNVGIGQYVPAESTVYMSFQLIWTALIARIVVVRQY